MQVAEYKIGNNTTIVVKREDSTLQGYLKGHGSEDISIKEQKIGIKFPII